MIESWCITNTVGYWKRHSYRSGTRKINLPRLRPCHSTRTIYRPITRSNSFKLRPNFGVIALSYSKTTKRNKIVIFVGVDLWATPFSFCRSLGRNCCRLLCLTFWHNHQCARIIRWRHPFLISVKRLLNPNSSCSRLIYNTLLHKVDCNK